MELQAIMDELRTLKPGHFPEEAVREATARREEVTPLLLEALEQTAAAPDSLADPEFTLPLHALYLLAQFREPRAWPVILRLFGQTGEAGEEISAYTGDFVPQDLPRVLASVYDGDLAPLLAVITNRDCDEWARGACVCTLARLAVEGRVPMAEVEAIFQKLLHGGLEREIKEGQEGNAWESLASSCCDLRLTGLQEDVLRACDEGLVLPGYITPTEIRADMRRPMDMKELREAYGPLINDAAAEMREWPCFTDPEWGKWEPEEEEPAVAASAQREEPKVGRNAPCPCGSGKKYKKCCGA